MPIGAPKKPTFSSALNNYQQQVGIPQMNMLTGYGPMLLNAQQALMNSFGPGADQANLDSYRNFMLQTASRAGQSGANQARWGGLGSGSQESYINQANMSALNDIGKFWQYQNSPEYKMQQFQGLLGASQPFAADTYFNYRNQQSNATSNWKQAHPKKQGLFGQILGAAGQFAGMGGFGNLFGGSPSAGAKYFQNPSNFSNFGTAFHF